MSLKEKRGQAECETHLLFQHWVTETGEPHGPGQLGLHNKILLQTQANTANQEYYNQSGL